MKQLLLAALLMAFGSTYAESPSGERLVYLVGCVNCHHQTPKEIFDAPPLQMVKAYTLDEFRSFIRTGVTRDGRDMLKQSSVMGIVATEQFNYFTDAEIDSVYEYLTKKWSSDLASREEAKIPKLFKQKLEGAQ